MPSRRIYVDLDDVIAETTSRFPAIVLELFGRTKAFEEIHTFHLDRAFELDADELRRLFERVHQGGFLVELEPREGALEVLAEWQKEGHEIRVVTGRPPQSLAHSREWLERLSVPHEHFHLCDKYGRFESSGDVLHLDEVRELDFDVAVEDSLDMACRLADWGVGQVLLLDRPWNRDVEELSGPSRDRIVRVESWREVRQLVSL